MLKSFVVFGIVQCFWKMSKTFQRGFDFILGQLRWGQTPIIQRMFWVVVGNIVFVILMAVAVHIGMSNHCCSERVPPLPLDWHPPFFFFSAYFSNTSLATSGALARLLQRCTAFKIQNNCKRPWRWLTGSWKLFIPGFLGTPINFL